MKQCVGFGDQRLVVERARRGDADAWVALYRSAYPGLVAYARRRLFSTEDAEDAASETMRRAVAGIARFEWRDGAGFDAWLYGILRNVVLNDQRRARRPDRYLAPSRPTDDEALAAVLDAEDADRVRAAFARLCRADQEVLELRVVAGLSADAVATVLNKRPGAVRAAQHRALVRLRAHFGTTDTHAADRENPRGR